MKIQPSMIGATLFCSLFGMTGCGSDHTSGDNGDNAVDAGRDAATENPDASIHGGNDAGGDASSASPDASNGHPDAGTPEGDAASNDAGSVDAGSVDAGNDAALDASLADAGNVSDAASGSDASPDASGGSGTDAALTCSAPTVTDLTATAGTSIGGQSFSETRALKITPSTDTVVSGLVLNQLEAGSAGTVGARIYDATSQALIASANKSVLGGTNPQIEVSLSAKLLAGQSYWVAFYADAGSSSATILEPSGLPYTSGEFNISAIAQLGEDGYPVNQSIFAPLISIESCPDDGTTN